VDSQERWISLAEAAATLRIAKEAVRKRAQRGKIKAKKVAGIWWVILDRVDETTNHPMDSELDQEVDQSTNHVDSPRDELVEALRSEVAFLRGQLEQFTHQRERDQSIIAGLTTRLPQLAMSSNSSPDSRSTSLPWWRRLFGWS
jgi:nicotinamidase-related amidase